MDLFGFSGKAVLVVGGASGMGEAAARLAAGMDADVTVMDVKEPLSDNGRFIPLDLRDESSIDAAIAAAIGPFDAILSCAGVADGTPGLPQVNFIGQRHLVESALDQGLVNDGGAIAMIASIGGISWTDDIPTVLDFLDTPDVAAASAWIDAHPGTDTYTFSKRAMIAYCARRAPALVARRIRINCIAPGPTKTPLMAANQGWEGFEQLFAAAMGHPGATPEEQAGPLLFLASDAARHVSGTCLVVDLGFTSGGLVGAVESPILPGLLPHVGAAG